MKISIAEVKRRLPAGQEFIGEFIGINAARCAEGMRVTRRRVVSNKSQLVSELLDGPKAGSSIYLRWANVTASERDGSIYLAMTETSPSEEFLKITLIG